MDITRRNFIKSLAAKSAITAAAAMFPGISFGSWNESDLSSGTIQWKKAPCRFCGTGCGLLIGISEERAVAVKGDPNCSVNKGLCCVKGYHSIPPMYQRSREPSSSGSSGTGISLSRMKLIEIEQPIHPQDGFLR